MDGNERNLCEENGQWSRWVRFWIISALVLLLLFSGGCGSGKQNEESRTGYYFDTVVSLRLYGVKGEAVFEGCFAICEELERTFSRTREDSELYAVNHRSTDTVEVSDELAKLIETGLSYYNVTDGAFDITVAPLSEIWDFKSGEGKVPSGEILQKALDKVDASKVRLEGRMLTFASPDTMLELGAIVKGYAADCLKEYLREQGVTAGTINLGGNVLTIGNKPDGTDWKIGLQKPFGDSGESIEIVEVADQSVVSSGVYERYFREAGRLYHHILDARTGYPVENGLWQVSIRSEDSLTGDLLSTVCFLLGPEKGMAYVESLAGVEASFIDADLQITHSSGW
ncbi:MAG TPA: FAD:protein FMN transferase [Lachnospiraceae bacterium]|nr:FAD:protein FMN transferase [Lachnospiraceae bacterium]